MLSILEPTLRYTQGQIAPARPRSRTSGVWRPGLDLNQDEKRCTAFALPVPPPGRLHHGADELDGRLTAGSPPALPKVNPLSFAGNLCVPKNQTRTQ